MEGSAFVNHGEGHGLGPLDGGHHQEEFLDVLAGLDDWVHGLLPVCAVGVADQVRRLAPTCPFAVEELVPDEQGKKDDEDEKVFHVHSMLMRVVDQVASVSMRTKRVLGLVGSAM